MKRITIITLFLLAFFVKHTNAQDDISAKLNKLVDEYNQKDLFSGTVLVMNNDTPVLEKAIGYSNYEDKTLNNVETVFNIGSIQKTFTHELIDILITEGKLSNSDKLGKYLTGFSDSRAENATIEQIINMEGGFGDFIMIPDIQQNTSRYNSIADFMGAIKKEPLLFDPGTDNMYSNSGYVILGAVIEKITGKTYKEYLTEKLLKPLGLSNSYFEKASDIKTDKATGYMVGPDGSKFRPQTFNLPPTPAGSMYSNIGDLNKFANYLYNKYGKEQSNAFAGGLPGWNSIMGLLGESGYTVIILSNYDEPSAENLFEQVIRVLKGMDYDPPKEDVGRFIYSEMRTKGMDEFMSNFEKTLADNGYKLENDMKLNALGYTLLNQGMVNEAISVFKMNIKLFPNVPNVYDSLGEAYMIAGKKEKAIENYEKVLEMDPGNKNAASMLKKLKM